MSTYYRQPLTVFGIVVPCLLMAAIAGVAFHLSSSTADEYKKKKVVYDKAQIASLKTQQLQAKVKDAQEHLKKWDEMLAAETRGTFLGHWKTAENKFKGRELTKKSHNWMNGSKGLGRGLQQPASQVNMSFAATYRAMQLSILEMETKLPQMQLDAMTMTPAANGELIDFNTTYTVWTQK